MESIRIPEITIGKRQFSLFWFWIALLAVGLLIGAVGAAQVLINGLSVTGLSNNVPWGFWIIIDLSAIALGGGAFTMGVVVYLLRMKQFELIGKLSVIIGFLGYSSAGLILLFDIGQPLRFWHPIIYWQPHSVLWEITMCVVLYLTVLGLELVPTVFEHPFFNQFSFLRKTAHFLHKFSPALAVAGLTLSLLHQASLGATYGVLSGRGLSFGPSAPLLFVLSAVGGGTALLFLLSVVVFRSMRPGLVSDKALYLTARIAGIFLLLYVYLKLWNWAVTNYYNFNLEIAAQLELLNQVAPYDAAYWIGEVLIGALIPGVVLFLASRIKNFKVLMAAAAMAVFGVVILRVNYNFSSLIATVSYVPFDTYINLSYYRVTWQELSLGIGVISYWLMGLSIAARFLPFFAPKTEEH